MPESETSDGVLRLCGECRILRAAFLDEVHLIGLSPDDLAESTLETFATPPARPPQ
jgi:hypothetical protein